MATNITTKQALRATFRELMKDVNTCIPGHVLIFDVETQTAQVQVGILRFDVNGASFAPPPILIVPVMFAGSHDYVLEHEIRPGTEGIIYFSQRCIDGWFQTGGVADNPIARFHDFSDAVFVPGIRSLSNVIPGWSNNGMRLRNRDGTQSVWLKSDGSIKSDNTVSSITQGADGSINMENALGYVRLGADGVVSINGVTFQPNGVISANGMTVDASGAISTPSDITSGGVSSQHHTHSGVTTGAGNTGEPN